MATSEKIAERLLGALSVLHCLPATRAEGSAVANGTVLRAPTMLGWARAAGFTEPEVLDIANDFWRFYRLSGVRGDLVSPGRAGRLFDGTFRAVSESPVREPPVWCTCPREVDPGPSAPLSTAHLAGTTSS